jgi:hypothetical protein
LAERDIVGAGISDCLIQYDDAADEPSGIARGNKHCGLRTSSRPVERVPSVSLKMAMISSATEIELLLVIGIAAIVSRFWLKV